MTFLQVCSRFLTHYQILVQTFRTPRCERVQPRRVSRDFLSFALQGTNRCSSISLISVSFDI